VEAGSPPAIRTAAVVAMILTTGLNMVLYKDWR